VIIERKGLGGASRNALLTSIRENVLYVARQGTRLQFLQKRERCTRQSRLQLAALQLWTGINAAYGMSLGLTDRRGTPYNLRLVRLLLGLVVFIHGVQQATKVVLRLGNVEQIGQRHSKDSKTGCPIAVGRVSANKESPITIYLTVSSLQDC